MGLDWESKTTSLAFTGATLTHVDLTPIQPPHHGNGPGIQPVA
jgi:hypothetical protein